MVVFQADCKERGCIHYQGLGWNGKFHDNVCKAFPKGIPGEIAFEGQKHLQPIKGQKNSIVFEKENKAV